ncbi:MAG TPA: helix-turn-helix transcriptional regulator [Fontimonas sp.]
MGTAAASMTVDAEMRVAQGRVQLVRFDMTQPADNVIHHDDSYWLDFSLTPRPRNARACYRERWSPQRYERLGKVFLLPPGETLQARSDGASSQTSILCHLRPDTLTQACGRELQWTDRRLQDGLDLRNPNVRSLLLRLAGELRHPGFASRVLVELMVGQLAIELARHCSSVADASAPGGGLAGWRLRLIDERLREPGAVPSLDELAALCRVSVRQLTRGFRSSRGCSIGEHMAAARIEHAKRLLHADGSIKGIAYTLGFATPSSFCYAFRRATGATPNEFRGRAPR